MTIDPEFIKEVFVKQFSKFTDRCNVGIMEMDGMTISLTYNDFIKKCIYFFSNVTFQKGTSFLHVPDRLLSASLLLTLSLAIYVVG